MSAEGDRPEGWVDLYWLPLGAGGHVVRRNGRTAGGCRRGDSTGPPWTWNAGLALADRQLMGSNQRTGTTD